MIGRGMFFLTRKPGLVQLQGHDGQLVEAWAFSLLERTRRAQQRVLAYWPRADADAFVMAHHAQLESGQALNLELERVKPSGDGLLGFVLSCALAPDRWPAHSTAPHPHSNPTGRQAHHPV